MRALDECPVIPRALTWWKVLSGHRLSKQQRVFYLAQQCVPGWILVGLLADF